eukprot:9180202-Pyramimonas_sp.AAC.1
MRAVPLGPFWWSPLYAPTKRCTGWWLTHAGGPIRTIGGVPHGATKRCAGWWLTHAGGPTGTIGGVPNGATKRCA